jgi:hypothetical protein
MADTKTTLLDANTTPAVTDLLPMVDDPGGSPNTQKMTIASLLTLAVSNVVVQTFGAGSANYTPTALMKKVLVVLVGGGGGGGNITAADDASGGGGGGGTCIRLCTAAEVGANVAYVVGAASAAGGAGNGSTFAVNTMAAGGGGVGIATGNNSTLGASAAGGAGGTASGGDLNIPGQPGGRSITYDGAQGTGGYGGASVFGGGGAESGTEAAGNNGGAYGGGGGGAHTAGDTNRNGGLGAAGVLYCIEFLD